MIAAKTLQAITKPSLGGRQSPSSAIKIIKARRYFLPSYKGFIIYIKFRNSESIYTITF